MGLANRIIIVNFERKFSRLSHLFSGENKSMKLILHIHSDDDTCLRRTEQKGGGAGGGVAYFHIFPLTREGESEQLVQHISHCMQLYILSVSQNQKKLETRVRLNDKKCRRRLWFTVFACACVTAERIECQAQWLFNYIKPIWRLDGYREPNISGYQSIRSSAMSYSGVIIFV